MIRIPRASAFFATAALLASLLPISAQGAGKPGASTPEKPLFYLFRAEPLGFPTDTVSARFEYRSEDRILGADRVQLAFKGAETLKVAIPPTIWTLPLGIDLRILVFADDLLLQDFDLGSLLAYNRVLEYTQPTERPVLGYKIFCQSPCGGGCGQFDDYDCDGVNNATDNCTDDANTNQADCDNDGYGDVCDATDGIFQATGSVDTCMTDKDSHLPPIYKSFEHHVEQRLVDVSSCNSPDRWNRWIRDEAYCFNLSDQSCCLGLSTSIQQVGDNPSYWCASGVRNVDFCH